MQDFKTIQDVYNHVNETYVIDLEAHALSLPDNLAEALIEPPEGLYIMGGSEPVFRKGQKYYRKSDFRSRNSTTIDVFDAKALVKADDDIVDSSGNTIAKRQSLRNMIRYMRPQPTIPVMAIRMAVCVVQRYLFTLCKQINHPSSATRLENLVKREHWDKVEREEFYIALDPLISEVAAFVNRDEWCVYFHKLKGTSMILEKGLDYRIICYYEEKFRESEQLELHG